MGIKRDLEHTVSRHQDSESDDTALRLLRGVSAAIHAVTGLEAAAGARRGDLLPPGGMRAVPALVAPLSMSAHLVHALRPTQRSRALARAADVLAIAAGTVGIASSMLAALEDEDQRVMLGRLPRRAKDRLPSLAPLAFALGGVLGLLLDGEERRQAQQLARLERAERRARVVERLVPKRRGRMDRIVLHA
jgi:hypothetical protein